MKKPIVLALVATSLILMVVLRGGPWRLPPQGRTRSPPACGSSRPAEARELPCAVSTAVSTATLVRVVDGDTVILRLSGRRDRVRLIGVDAPETWLRRDCYGAQATRALRRLTPPGAAVRVRSDTEPRDHYGRLLSYLWTSGGTFVNAELVREGFARTMPIPPNTTHAADLEEAQRVAQHAHAGLWRSCT